MAQTESPAPAAFFTDLSQFGLLRFSGQDAGSFLQGQLSSDVGSLQPLQAQYGSYSTPKGRMLASFLLWRSAEAYYMQLPRSLCESICKRLAMFILRAKVTVEDASADHILIGVAGAEAVTHLGARFGALPTQTLHLLQREASTILKLDSERFEIIVPAAAISELRDALTRQIAPSDPSAWDLLDIRAGIPYITPATQEQFVPQMANLDLIGGVSFSKGCYPGQEIVARMHYLGKLKQRMALAHIATATAPQPGDKVFSQHLGDQASGMIVNAAPAPQGGYDALAVLQIESAAQNDAHWKTLDGPTLEFKPLPYKLPD